MLGELEALSVAQLHLQVRPQLLVGDGQQLREPADALLLELALVRRQAPQVQDLRDAQLQKKRWNLRHVVQMMYVV